MKTYADVNYNYHEYSDGKIYLTLGMHLGVATKYFLINQKEIFINNLAFSNMWANYLKEVFGFQFNIDRAVMSITYVGHVDTVGRDIIWFLKSIFQSDYDEAMFLKIKKYTIQNFEKAYKSGEFRGWYKSFEISEFNKGFSLERLISDLQEMTFQDFLKCQKFLITPYNSSFFVNGNLRDLTDKEVVDINKVITEKRDQAVLSAQMKDPYLRHDVHLLALSREAQNIDTVYFSFDRDVGMMDRLLYMVIETEKIPYAEKRIHLDELDASVIVSEDEVEKLKNFYKKISTKQQFERARDINLRRYVNWLEQDPEQFGNMFTECELNHISFFDYLKTLSSLSYDIYQEVATKIKPMISEAQIVMRKG